ncbi:MAG TPA: ATP-binding protein, partial [Pyrinomonadaceae bacterium]|nr:ATP-binding protein [Pyrinomonadaceae bacterium]
MRRSGNHLTLDSLSGPRDVRDLVKQLYTVVQFKGFEEVVVDFRNVSRAYPNTCVPVVGVVNYYRGQNIDVRLKNLLPFLRNTQLENPVHANRTNVESSNGVLSKVWRFDDAQGVSVLTKAYVTALSEKVECKQAVLEAFEWCINEVMDNVLQHSREKEGFVMVAIYTERRRVAICLTDTGIGIYRSLRDSIHKPKNSVDAITMAVKEGVTRNSKEHQGNGLWGLLEIVSENKGRLNIISGNGSVYYRSDGQVETFDKVPYLDQTHQCTTVD